MLICSFQKHIRSKYTNNVHSPTHKTYKYTSYFIDNRKEKAKKKVGQLKSYCPTLSYSLKRHVEFTK